MEICSKCGRAHASPEGHGAEKCPIDATPTGARDPRRPSRPDAAAIVGATLPPGSELLGKVAISGLVAQTKQRETYDAHHLILGRRLRVHLLCGEASAQPELVARFTDAMGRLTNLRDPRLLDIYEVFTIHDRPAVLSEVTAGVALHDALAAAPLPWHTDAIRRWIVPALEALDALHRAGVVHGALDPDGLVQATRDGAVKLVGLVDLRLSPLVLDAPPDDVLDVQRAAPEWFAAPDLVGPAADLYTVGCLLFELATGEPVFPWDDPLAIMVSHMREQPRAPSDVRPGLSPGLERIILRALSKNPAYRFESAAQMARALNRFDTYGRPVPVGRAPWEHVAIPTRPGGTAPTNKATTTPSEGLEDLSPPSHLVDVVRDDAEGVSNAPDSNSPDSDEPVLYEGNAGEGPAKPHDPSAWILNDDGTPLDDPKPHTVEDGVSEVPARSPNEEGLGRTSGSTSPVDGVAHPPASTPDARTPTDCPGKEEGDDPDVPPRKAQRTPSSQDDTTPASSPRAAPRPPAAPSGSPLRRHHWLHSPRWRALLALVGVALGASVAAAVTVLTPHLGDEAILQRSSSPGDAAALESALVDEDMVVVPRGGLLYGGHPSHPGWERNQLPLRLVEVGAFAIDRREVSYGEYLGCVEARACSEKPLVRTLAGLDGVTEANHEAMPLAFVNWEDAQGFCEWRGKRLPTEIEWERAARGSSGAAFPWGDTFACYRATTSGAGCGATITAVRVDRTPTGGMSPWGVEGLAGNLWEWTADLYAEPAWLAKRSPLNPEGPTEGPGRVVKGGDFASPPRAIGWRAHNSSTVYSDRGGFRCARDVTTTAQTGMFELFDVVQPDRGGLQTLFSLSHTTPLVPLITPRPRALGESESPEE